MIWCSGYKPSREWHRSSPCKRWREKKVGTTLHHSVKELYGLRSSLNENPANYNNPLVVEIQGSLNVEALVKSYQAIIDRHEVFRSTFVFAEGDAAPQINIHSKFTLSPGFIDLSGFDKSQAQDRLQKLIEKDSEHKFNLERLPLFNFTLVQVSPRHYYLLTTMHHFLTDAWSMNNFVSELSMRYRAFAEGKPQASDSLSIQNVDYGAWQHNFLEETYVSREQEWWENELAGQQSIVLQRRNQLNKKRSDRGVSS